jgi:hypothetical protein
MRFFPKAIGINLGDKPRVMLFASADIADVANNYNSLRLQIFYNNTHLSPPLVIICGVP